MNVKEGAGVQELCLGCVGEHEESVLGFHHVAQ